MNRYFDFTSGQLKAVIALGGLLLVTSVYTLLRGFSAGEPDALPISVSIGDNDSRYSPLFKVDLNRTPADSLELLPGIGPVLAERIVAYRDSTGGFQSLEELMKVHGIGYRLFDRLKPYLELRPW